MAVDAYKKSWTRWWFTGASSDPVLIAEARRLYEGGQKLRPVARLLGVPEDIVSSWVRHKGQRAQAMSVESQSGTDLRLTPGLDNFRSRFGLPEGAKIWVPLDPPDWKVDDNPWELLYYRVNTIVGDRVAVVLPTGTRETAYHTSLASLETLAAEGELVACETQPWYELKLFEFCRRHRFEEARLVVRVESEARWIDEMRDGYLMYRVAEGNYGRIAESEAVALMASGRLGSAIALNLKDGSCMRYPRPDDPDVMAVARILEKHTYVSGNGANHGTPRECQVWRALARAAKDGGLEEWGNCLQDSTTVYSRAGDPTRVMASMLLIWLLTVNRDSPLFKQVELPWGVRIPWRQEEPPLLDIASAHLRSVGESVGTSGIARLLR